MATTFIRPYKKSGDKTALATMMDSFDYGLNPDKCAAVSSYLCQPETAAQEFILIKNQYEAITNRSAEKGHLFFQIRQAFPFGEVSVEEAQKIGYETAMRWTKGKHQFFVCTHTDKKHIHNHVYYNSTSEDCKRKFHNFLGSTFAVRRLSDRICLEHDLSVVIDPKQRSKTKFKHYGEWLGSDKKPTFQAMLKSAIDSALSSQPESFEVFLALMNQAGFEHKWGRGGVLSFRNLEHEQVKFTRLRSSTLGYGYSVDDIKAIIDSRVPFRSGKTIPAQRKVNLIIDIQEKMKDGKGAAYARWASVYNLKQMAAALQYLQENNLIDYDDLSNKADEATERFHAVSDKLKEIEKEMSRNADLKSAIVDYARTRPIFEEYKAKKYSNKFLRENEPDIAIYRAAQKSMRDILNGGKLPKMDVLKAEWQSLKSKKKAEYIDYRKAQKDMRDVIAVKANIDHLLGVADRSRNKEQER